MRQSFYNVMTDVPDSSETLLYNTLTQSFLQLTPDERSVYCEFGGSSKGHADPEISDGFRQTLVKGGFILDDPESQSEYIRYQCEKYKYDSKVLELYILPTLDCNFRCVYCYENKRKGKMSEHVQNCITDFVDSQFREQPFKTLKIVWYGGEPLLCMDVIERLSDQLVGFCAENHVQYLASIISNSALVDDEVLRKLKECKIWSFMVTTDGVSEAHDERRISCRGNSTYETIMGNIDKMIDMGYGVDFRCNVEKNNLSSCLDLAEKMYEKENLTVFFSQIEDMNGFMEGGDSETLPMDLLSLEEYAHAWFDMFMLGRPDAQSFKKALRPLWMPCPGTMDRGFAIDERGNVYNCACQASKDEKVLFNVCDQKDNRQVNWPVLLHTMTMNPVNLDSCHYCPVLPLCAGGCARPRTEEFQKCRPFKYIIEDFLLKYYQALNQSAEVESLS